MSVLNDIIILDDFYTDPEALRNYALSLNYDAPFGPEAWRGFRCREPAFAYVEWIKNRLTEIDSKFKPLSFEGFFHYCLNETKNTCSPCFELGRIHCDDSIYAGVLYLTPFPDINSGTSFFDRNLNLHSSVENKFNRLVFYPSSIPHAPSDLFGTSIEDARLSLNIFAY